MEHIQLRGFLGLVRPLTVEQEWRGIPICAVAAGARVTASDAPLVVFRKMGSKPVQIEELWSKKVGARDLNPGPHGPEL